MKDSLRDSFDHIDDANTATFEAISLAAKPWALSSTGSDGREYVQRVACTATVASENSLRVLT